jgi:hypothetical protein
MFYNRLKASTNFRILDFVIIIHGLHSNTVSSSFNIQREMNYKRIRGEICGGPNLRHYHNICFEEKLCVYVLAVFLTPHEDSSYSFLLET